MGPCIFVFTSYEVSSTAGSRLLSLCHCFVFIVFLTAHMWPLLVLIFSAVAFVCAVCIAAVFFRSQEAGFWAIGAQWPIFAACYCIGSIYSMQGHYELGENSRKNVATNYTWNADSWNTTFWNITAWINILIKCSHALIGVLYMCVMSGFSFTQLGTKLQFKPTTCIVHCQ